MPPEIYLDNAATTFQDPRVIEATAAFLAGRPGNASSLHAAGRRASVAVEKARVQVARLAGADPEEVTFTSGGTEANNIALQGAAQRLGRSAHFIVSAIEHSSILDQLSVLEAQGIRISLAPVDSTGRIILRDLALLFRPETRLVSVMHVNNEIGTIQPLSEIASVCRANSALFHVDAIQSYGKLPIDFKDSGIDMLSLSAHKIHGPSGIGALVVRKGVALSPVLRGGKQERGLRPGTHNAVGIVGFGAAAALCRFEDAAGIAALRDRLWELIQEKLPQASLNGSLEYRVCHNLHITVPGKPAAELAALLDQRGACVSTGSACHAGSSKPSHVLTALDPGGPSRDGMRISLSRFTTEEEVVRFAEILAECMG
ncbi:MAG: cysteine desulfurase family protein [Bdellovibrionota bacterium]